MHVRIGCAPNLPWWRLQTMTDKEVLEYNQRFIIEETTEMEEFDNEKQLKELEKFLDGFEERLTEYVKNSHAISYQMGERADKRDVYENGKLDGWNAAIERVAKMEEDDAIDECIKYLICHTVDYSKHVDKLSKLSKLKK